LAGVYGAISRRRLHSASCGVQAGALGGSGSTAAEPVVAQPSVPVSYTTPVSEFAPDMLASSRLSAEQLDAPGGPPSPTGFIGGALKRTKDSLAKTGAVTSASLGNAVRGVVGAFKKVSPF
jgi:hypothetical protein